MISKTPWLLAQEAALLSNSINYHDKETFIFDDL